MQRTTQCNVTTCDMIGHWSRAGFRLYQMEGADSSFEKRGTGVGLESHHQPHFHVLRYLALTWCRG
jgi:hypothetical protein